MQGRKNGQADPSAESSCSAPAWRLIEFKKQILQEVTCCRLFTANYPLLIEHIIREAELYQKMIASLEDGTCKSVEQMAETERFWNQIMMEHALFIRGLLDPTEGELIETADSFAGDYQRLLEEARQKDCRAMNGLTRKTLETTIMRCDSDSGKKLIKSMVLRTADRQGMC